MSLAKDHRHSQSNGANRLLYTPKGRELLKHYPDYGQSKLRNLDISRLPELNIKYHEQYFKRVKKHLAREKEEDDNGPAVPIKSRKSVE